VLSSVGLLETPTLVVRCLLREFEIGELDAYIVFDTRLFGVELPRIRGHLIKPDNGLGGVDGRHT
jgi:hypothetical protein